MAAAAGLNGNEPAEVVYIAGAPRSGTTIVASLLGELPGFFNAGEVRFLWRQLARSGRCGCGQQLATCEVWARILGASLDPTAEAPAARLADGGAAHSLIRTLPVILALGGPRKAVREHAAHTLPVYAAIAAASGAGMIVDSSKSPSYAHVLAGSPHLRLHVVHLVRDPRAVVYSWLRERRVNGKGPLGLQATVYEAAKWTAWNLWIEMWLRARASTYTRLTYEDLMEAPRERLGALVASHGHASAALPFTEPDGHTVSLRGNHSVFGNGYRFFTGSVVIRADDEWRRWMSWPQRAAVTSLSWPLLLRYGYHTRPAASTGGRHVATSTRRSS